MKRIGVALACVMFVSGLCCGQEPGQNYEHLKNYEAFIGTWEYDGPTPEEVGGLAKGTRIVVRISWEWIFNKKRVEHNWTVTRPGATGWSLKNLHGWDDEKGHIVIKGFSSSGKPFEAIVTFSFDGKELTQRPDRASDSGLKYTALDEVVQRLSVAQQRGHCLALSSCRKSLDHYTVSGLTMMRADLQCGQRRISQTQNTRSRGRSLGRLLDRFITASCWRRARISTVK